MRRDAFKMLLNKRPIIDVWQGSEHAYEMG